MDNPISDENKDLSNFSEGENMKCHYLFYNSFIFCFASFLIFIIVDLQCYIVSTAQKSVSVVHIHIYTLF